MPELADLIEKILLQQLREERHLQDLEIQAANIRESIANAKEEIAQLLAALEIAVKRGMAEPINLDAIQARLIHGPQGHLFTEGNQDHPPLDFSRLVSHVGELPTEEDGQEQENGEEEEQPTPPAPRGRKSLIDTVYEIIQDFDFDKEFTTNDIRRELAERHPEKFASINPASISGTVARLYRDYDTGLERVGEYTDGIHYRRKAKKEDTEKGGESDALQG